MRRWARLAALGAAATAMTACGSSGGAGAQPPAGRSMPPVRHVAVTTGDPAGLVGAWHLTAPGEPASAVLTIGDRVDGGILLFRPCGMLSGTWRANRHGMFLAWLTGGDGACFHGGKRPEDVLPRWLSTVTSYSADGRDELLLDATGGTVARLRPGAHPTVGPNDSQQFVDPPVVTEQMRSSWVEPAALPTGVQPATNADVRHRWHPVGRPSSLAYVRFLDDGRYDGSDGCNGQGGRYAVGPGGLLLATSGPSTEIGCENSPLPSWVGSAGRLGMRQGRLVFVAPDGKVLGEAMRRLSRAQPR